MNIKKIVLSASAAALIGGFAFAPNAQAGEGDCGNLVASQEGVVAVYGEQPGAGDGCLVAEGDGLAVNPLDDGHIGIYEKSDGTPGAYGSCDGRDEDGDFKVLEPGGDTGNAQEACTPG